MSKETQPQYVGQIINSGLDQKILAIAIQLMILLNITEWNYEDFFLMKFWNKLLKNRIYEINYEDLTVNHKVEIKKLIKHLGLTWEESCLYPEKNKRSVSTASNIQIRNKIFKGSSQKWKKYKPFKDVKWDA